MYRHQNRKKLKKTDITIERNWNRQTLQYRKKLKNTHITIERNWNRQTIKLDGHWHRQTLEQKEIEIDRH